MDTEEKIVKLVKQVGTDLPDDYYGIDLFEDGILDSLAVMQLIEELDETFDIDIDVDDVIPDNFDTIEHLVAMVRKYCK